MNEKLEKVIEEIANNCIDNYELYSDKINFSNGCSGISVFFATLYTYTNNEKFKVFAQLLINNSFDKLNRIEYSVTGTFFDGISGIAWSLNYLRENNVVDFDDEILEEFDEIILKFLQEPFTKNEYDLLHGYLGIAIYVLERRSKNYKKIIEKVVKKLFELNESTSPDEMKWHDYWGGKGLDHKEEKIWNLGLAHGIPSIVVFFCKCYKAGICKMEAKEAVRKTLNWIHKQQNENHFFSNYPIAIATHRDYSKESRLGWCFGDFGPLFAFLHAGNTFKNNDWIIIAESISLRIAKRRLEDKTMVRDSCFCHGASGIAYMLTQIDQTFHSQDILKCKDYWINFILSDYHKNDNTFLTYYKRDTEKKHKYIKEYGILNGVSGIGLALLGCISISSNNWSAPFMLNV